MKKVLFILFYHINLLVECLDAPIRVLPNEHRNLPADGFKFITSHSEEHQDNISLVRSEVSHSSEVDLTTKAPTSRTKQTIATTKPPHYGLCVVKYIPGTCKPNNLCGTKKLCIQITGSPCCGPSHGECPLPIQLDIRCVKGNPINWCHHHKDCSRSALCCDTGCGYNMCIEQSE